MSTRKRLESASDDTIGTYGHLRYSIFQAAAVYDVRLSKGDVNVLAALGTHATAARGYWCWPEVTTLACRLGLSVRRVQQSISKLERSGYVQVCERYDPENKRQLANGYRLIMDYELPDEHRREHHDRPRKGIGGRPRKGVDERLSSPGSMNSEFTGESELPVHPESELPVHPESELRIRPLESEKKKQRTEAENMGALALAVAVESAELHPDELTDALDTADAELKPAPDIWRRACDELVTSCAVSKGERDTWLARAHLLCVVGLPGCYFVAAPTSTAAKAIRSRFTERIERALERVTGAPDVAVEVSVQA